MNKRVKIITITSLWIASSCAIAMFGTLLSDHLISIGWFADHSWIIPNDGNPYTRTEWSMRHVWYAWTFAILFLGSVVNAIIYAINSFEEA